MKIKSYNMNFGQCVKFIFVIGEHFVKILVLENFSLPVYACMLPLLSTGISILGKVVVVT